MCFEIMLWYLMYVDSFISCFLNSSHYSQRLEINSFLLLWEDCFVLSTLSFSFVSLQVCAYTYLYFPENPSGLYRPSQCPSFLLQIFSPRLDIFTILFWFNYKLLWRKLTEKLTAQKTAKKLSPLFSDLFAIFCN